MVGCHVDAIIYHQFVINPFLDFPTARTMLAGSWEAGELAVMLLAYVLLAAAAAVVCSGSRCPQLTCPFFDLTRLVVY